MSDDEYQRLLDQFPDQITKRLNWSKYLDRLFQAGRRTGLSDPQIRRDAWEKLQGRIGESTFRALMPPSAKDQKKANVRYALNQRMDNPTIPPSPQVIHEIEPEPPKAIDEPIQIPDREIILDCNKFRSELRIHTINGDKAKLRIDKLNQVVAVE